MVVRSAHTICDSKLPAAHWLIVHLRIQGQHPFHSAFYRNLWNQLIAPCLKWGNLDHFFLLALCTDTLYSNVSFFHQINSSLPYHTRRPHCLLHHRKYRRLILGSVGPDLHYRSGQVLHEIAENKKFIST